MESAENEELHRELAAIAGDESAIEDRFYRELEFGTGGLRGVLGAGSNRMNVYTVGKATQGYSNYLKKNFPTPTVAITYDSRIHSDLFAQTATAIFAANDIQVHLYPKLMPTPSLSFAVRDLHCSGGIVITASHNPAKYNGYKVSGSDGCQITTEAAKAIQQEIDGVDAFADVPRADFPAQLQSGRITYIGEDTVERYIFGFEESYGYLSGSFVRDKDAVNASLLICEMFVYYRVRGQSLLDILEELYKAYGYYQSRLLSFTFEGPSGFAKMQELMRSLREYAPQEIAGYSVEAVGDYQQSVLVRRDGTQEEIRLPKSNVLRFFLSSGLEAVVRPSGTEPKLKVYVTAIGASREESCGAAETISEHFAA